jgi:hypothetical protein
MDDEVWNSHSDSLDPELIENKFIFDAFAFLTWRLFYVKIHRLTRIDFSLSFLLCPSFVWRAL